MTSLLQTISRQLLDSAFTWSEGRRSRKVLSEVILWSYRSNESSVLRSIFTRHYLLYSFLSLCEILCQMIIHTENNFYMQCIYSSDICFLPSSIWHFKFFFGFHFNHHQTTKIRLFKLGWFLTFFADCRMPKMTTIKFLLLLMVVELTLLHLSEGDLFCFRSSTNTNPSATQAGQQEFLGPTNGNKVSPTAVLMVSWFENSLWC